MISDDVGSISDFLMVLLLDSCPFAFYTGFHRSGICNGYSVIDFLWNLGSSGVVVRWNL